MHESVTYDQQIFHAQKRIVWNIRNMHSREPILLAALLRKDWKRITIKAKSY